MTGVVWTDAPAGTAGHVDGKLVVQIRKLGVGGWSGAWRNGMKWDVSDQLQNVKAQASRHFESREAAKQAVEEALGAKKRRGRPLGSKKPDAKTAMIRVRVTAAQEQAYERRGGDSWLRKTLDETPA